MGRVFAESESVQLEAEPGKRVTQCVGRIQTLKVDALAFHFTPPTDTHLKILWLGRLGQLEVEPQVFPFLQ